MAEGEVCNTSSIDECSHFGYVDPSDTSVCVGDDYVYVAANVLPQTAFQIQRIADKHFPNDQSGKAHVGNRSKAVEHLLKHAVKFYESVGDRGTFDEMMSRAKGSGSMSDDIERINELEQRVQELESEIEEKKRKIERLKRSSCRGDRDLIKEVVLDCLQSDGLTFDEMVGSVIEDSRIEWSESRTRSLTDSVINDLLENDLIEVRRKNGRTLYRKTS